MTVVLDHTIVPVNDREQAVEFYSRIFGFEELGEIGPFLAVRVNDGFNLDFRKDEDFRSIHYAFAMDPDEFEAAFQRVKDAKIPYGGQPICPGQHAGAGDIARGQGRQQRRLLQGPQRPPTRDQDLLAARRQRPGTGQSSGSSAIKCPSSTLTGNPTSLALGPFTQTPSVYSKRQPWAGHMKTPVQSTTSSAWWGQTLESN